MPFSSPMGEEFLSPTSPNIPTWERRKNGVDSVTEGDDQLRNGNTPLHKPPKRQLSQRKEEGRNKIRWPGLNVATSFSKSPVVISSGVNIDHKNPRRLAPQTLNAQSGFVALSAIKAPNNKKGNRGFKAQNQNKPSASTVKSDLELRNHTEAGENQGTGYVRGTEGLGLQPPKDPPAYDAGVFRNCKDGVDSFKPSPTHLTGLSPSCGPIVIGISVPSAKLAEHAISPDVEATPITTATVITDQAIPETPTIVVTPAEYQGPWHFPLDDTRFKARGRPRPSSSLYSQAIEQGGYMTGDRGTPPHSVYADVPFRLKHAVPTNPAESIDATISHERPESTCTVFDEDDDPIAPIYDQRPGSGESRLRILNRSSLDTIATKHRSQGWWNYIVSPFLPRSNTTSFGGWAMKASSPVPALPSPAPADVNSRAQQVSGPSPATPISILDSETTEKDRSSIWADLRRLEAERLKISISFDRTFVTNSPLEHPRLLKNSHDSNAPQSFEGFGAAAEYFNTCWHDQNSPNPYFECQNHLCIPFADDSSLSVEEHGRHIDVGPPRAELKGQNVQAAGCEFRQEPANRFSAAFSQANNSKRGALSDSVTIEDSDATPEVHEARIAPIVRAGPPIAAVPVAALSAAPTAEPEGAASRIAQRSNPTSPLAITSFSVRAEPLVALPAPPEASQDPAPMPVAPSTNSSTTLQPSLPEHALPISPKQAGGIPQQLPMYFPSRSDILPEQFVAPNPISQVHSKHEPFPSFRPAPSISERGESPRQMARGKEVPNENPVVPAHNTYVVNHYYDQFGPSKQREKAISDDMEPPLVVKHKSVNNWERQEKANHRSRGGRACALTKSRGCFKRDKRPMTRKKKRLLWGIAISLVLIIILILALAMTLTRKGDDLEVQSQWLNITGFPPIPTGISTIVQPDAVREDSGCIQPATVWSCALPKEEQKSIAPNSPNQPNFRVEIRFSNGTSTNSTLTNSGSPEKRSIRSGSNPVSAGSFVRRKYLRIRDSPTDSLLSPSPPPPTQEDQAFLGKTTDNNSAPFNGEVTPFFMSFVPASKLPVQRLMKRQEEQGKNNSDRFPDITKTIPPPDTNSDGTAAAANLHPFPVAQPLRLYNRGLATEHYGFYTYFDRSIFLKSTSLLNEKGPTLGDVPADQVGGADKSAATVRCTWRQTRFLVQIWTNSGAAAPLLGSSNATSTRSKERDDPNSLTSSSANNFVRPGSFPYPVSITLDRHGGALNQKFIFCYGLDNRGRIVSEKKKIQLEDRAFGGKLVNPALGPFKSVEVGKKEGGPGGIDGGSGGCGCQWRNWGGTFGTPGRVEG